VMVLFFLPETLRKKQENQAKVHQVTVSEKKESAIMRAISPFKPMLHLLLYPNVIIITIYNSVIFGSLYFMVTASSMKPNSRLSLFSHD
jgi:hypothetical protein